MKKQITLRVKLLVPIILIVIVGLTLSGILSYQAASDALRTAVIREAAAKGEGLTKIIGMAFSDTHKALQAVALRPLIVSLLTEGVTPERQQEVNAELEAIRRQYPLFQRIGLLGPDGVTLANSTASAVGANLSAREYFQKALRGEACMAPVSTSAISGKQFTAMSVPVRAKGKVVGVLYGAIDIPPFAEEYVDHVRLGAEGYAFVLAKDNNVIMHPDKALIGTREGRDNPVMQRVAREKNGSFFYAWGNTRKLCSFFLEPVTGWVVAISGTESEMLAPIAKLRSIAIWTGGITLALTVLIISWLIGTVINSLNTGVRFAEAVASGDLDQHLTLNRNDELGKLSTALTTMVAKLKAMIAEAEASSREAAAQTEKAQDAMRQAEVALAKAESAKQEGMHHAADQVSGIIDELTKSCALLQQQITDAANGASDQLARTQETATAMDQMNDTVLDAARNAAIAADSSENARQKALSGAAVVGDVLSAITGVSTASDKLQANLSRLGERAEGIGEVLGIISDIADQTNLLALNAAIEAARAGDAGRGFAVVADEVRKLAEKTMQATHQVREAVGAIQQETSSSIKDMDESLDSVKRSSEFAQAARTSLQEIVDIVEETASQVRAIAAAVEEQSATTQEISHHSDVVKSTAESTASTMANSLNALDKLAELTRSMQKLVENLRT